MHHLIVKGYPKFCPTLSRIRLLRRLELIGSPLPLGQLLGASVALRNLPHLTPFLESLSIAEYSLSVLPFLFGLSTSPKQPVDFSRLRSLQLLNPIPTSLGREFVSALVDNCPKLQILKASTLNFQPYEWQGIFSLLSRLSDLEELHTEAPIASKSWGSLRSCKSLKMLWLSNKDTHRSHPDLPLELEREDLLFVPIYVHHSFAFTQDQRFGMFLDVLHRRKRDPNASPLVFDRLIALYSFVRWKQSPSIANHPVLVEATSSNEMIPAFDYFLLLCDCYASAATHPDENDIRRILFPYMRGCEQVAAHTLPSSVLNGFRRFFLETRLVGKLASPLLRVVPDFLTKAEHFSLLLQAQAGDAALEMLRAETGSSLGDHLILQDADVHKLYTEPILYLISSTILRRIVRRRASPKVF